MGMESFHQLLQRYLDGQCTPAEERLVDHWYHMLEGDDKHEISASNLDALENAMWQKIHSEVNGGMEAPPDRTHFLQSRYLRHLLAAASVALLITVGTIAYNRIICYPVEPSFTTDVAVDCNIVIEFGIASLLDCVIQ